MRSVRYISAGEISSRDTSEGLQGLQGFEIPLYVWIHLNHTLKI